ncbi:hypothetical protein [Bacteroides acidifaciens]|uniref:DUF1570 domain-containing protein n=1 Tax=Bacteroides acidifaciens TaxID=85831 RepID=A0A7K3MKJ6_9BACE|nr:hypothetical protein [Bacteroides acidifaciens]MBF0730203.1 hypothetical protein [Bacteroides acidifaciens]MBF0833755.1 hypothetical protein [Bacteroides acidifaciens]NDO54838.1 hypothetical protein [Bacteroides acidifaciens]TFU49075.1 hypothetical protein E4T97_11890 [Bacteroides acidifaciens]
MRAPFLLFPLFIFCGLLNAQTVKIEYAGDPLPDKDRRNIEEFISYEVNFYTQFGLPDTLTLQLHVFEDRKKAMEYLESVDIHLPLLFKASGIYSPKLQKAIILGREKGQERSLAIIYHELSHHFVRQILGKFPPSWLNEGLSEYFEHCKVTKKGLRHTFTEYEQGRIRTMYMLGEIDLLAFMNSGRGKFMKRQATDEQYSYILAHALVTFWIEKAPRDTMKKLIVSLQNKNDSSTVSERIDSVYLGGFQKFEKDFEAAYK